MSSESHYISVMKGKLRTFWTVMAGVFLTARVCDAGCIKHSFKEHITKNLLVDHWFQMKNFTPTGKEVTEQHEFLSVLNTICSSLIINKEFIISDPLKGGSQARVMWTYIQMVKALVNGSKNWTENDTIQFCSNSCSESYGISFINTTQFEKIYKKVCVQSGTLPECPPSLTEQQTSSGDGNTSELSKTRDVLKSGLIVSAVVSIIAVIIIITVIIVVFFKCSNNNNQASVNQESTHLQDPNTENMSQEQNNERPEEGTSSVG
ncbi:uncharacterized protein LOC132860724 isoform X2 [Tachysurus vachellii]|uniref:uncharacterized protein LOC132860724 isoform X2 n=1 Tax=Tachysurus vachellii TaxID=175792 RepID=UPI00296B16BB|nr:uncharacterized protein LOC132860724 isoform X2 [Tachysurus vachellii]